MSEREKEPIQFLTLSFPQHLKDLFDAFMDLGLQAADQSDSRLWGQDEKELYDWISERKYERTPPSIKTEKKLVTLKQVAKGTLDYHCPVIENVDNPLKSPCWQFLENGVCPIHGKIYE